MKYNFETEVYFDVFTKSDLLDAMSEPYPWALKLWTVGEIESLPEDCLWLNGDIEIWEDVAKILRPYLVDGEICVRIQVEGWHTPAKPYLANGDPGYPEEGGEERIITEIVIGNHAFSDSKHPEIFDKLYEFFENQVVDIAIDYLDI